MVKQNQSTIGRLISILYRQAQIFHTQQLKEFNISASEFPFLLYLDANDGVTQETFVQYYGMDKAAVTRSIQSLEEKNLIYRAKSKEDLRCNHIHLTENARCVMPYVKERVERWNTYLREDLNQNELEMLLRILAKMVEKVENNRNGDNK